MTTQEIRTLFDYDHWATEKLLSIIGEAPAEVYLRQFGSSHGGLRGTLVHMIGASDVWFKRWRGENPTTPWREEDFPAFRDIEDRWLAAQPMREDFLASLSDERLGTPWTYRDMKGNPHTQVLWKQMQHLVNHGSYHRGQLVTLLRMAGMKPVGTDLIYYYREKDTHG